MSIMDQQYRIAFFISAHGFGHAARACAVMESILESDPGVCFEIFTNAPKWFFADSMRSAFGYHYLKTDIGTVQSSPFQTDVQTTLDNLKCFLPFDNDLIAKTAQDINQMACRMVLCDIAPLGIAIARKAGIPSVLIENFTWDWIYKGFQSNDDTFKTYVEYLKAYFEKATYHIQTDPVCHPVNTDLRTGPAARKIRNSADYVRQRLGIAPESKVVMLTFGGVPDAGDYIASAQKAMDVHFIIPGNFPKKKTLANVTVLPYRSEFYHPDLINAADVVIGKAGYSTIAEVLNAGKPFGYISRPDFRESTVLSRFIEDRITGFPIAEADLHDGTWAAKVPALLEMPPGEIPRLNGADEIAGFILKGIDLTRN